MEKLSKKEEASIKNIERLKQGETIVQKDWGKNASYWNTVAVTQGHHVVIFKIVQGVQGGEVAKTIVVFSPSMDDYGKNSPNMENEEVEATRFLWCVERKKKDVELMVLKKFDYKNCCWLSCRKTLFSLKRKLGEEKKSPFKKVCAGTVNKMRETRLP